MNLPVVAAVLGVLVAVNLISNRWRQRWYLQTCLGGTAVLLLLARLSGTSWSALGLGAGSYLTGLVWGAAGVLTVLGAYVIARFVAAARPFFDHDAVDGQSAHDVLRHGLVVIPFGTVLFEEVAFRGVLLGVVDADSGAVWAVLVSSVAFGLWHILPSLGIHTTNAGVGAVLGAGRRAQVATVTLSILGTAVAGGVFCLLRLGSGSLITPMALHWSVNGFGLFFAWLALRRRAASGR